MSGQKFGTLNVYAYGGTVQERTAALNALGDVFTKSAQGGEELKALESRKTWFGMGSTKPYDVIIAKNPTGSYTYVGSQALVLDPSQVGNAALAAGRFANPSPGFTYQRIVAHELGHGAMGTLDGGKGHMDNVIKNENVIMRQLGDTNDRIVY